MAKKDRTTLTILANQISTEVSEKANTAARIGGMDLDIIDSFVHKDDPPATLPKASDAFTPTGGNLTKKDLGDNNLVCEFEDVDGTYALPVISGLTATNYMVQLKNVSGGGITITSADGIESEASVDLTTGENLTIYISTSEYKIL